MNYRICSEEKEICATYRNVFFSFGYEEAVFDEITGNSGSLRLIGDFDDLKCKTVLFGENRSKCYAEAVAVGIEAGLAVGYPGIKVRVKCDSEEVSELIYLYGLDEYAEFESGEFSFEGLSGKNVLFTGNVVNGGVVCTYDLASGAAAMKGCAFGNTASRTVIYPEKDAEGIAYEISYTLRLYGCLAEMYTGNGSIEDCEKYASGKGASDIIRVFPDGKLQIKSLAENEITETDYETFVGYYEDDDHDEHNCGCGHDHHGHDCHCHEH